MQSPCHSVPSPSLFTASSFFITLPLLASLPSGLPPLSTPEITQREGERKVRQFIVRISVLSLVTRHPYYHVLRIPYLPCTVLSPHLPTTTSLLNHKINQNTRHPIQFPLGSINPFPIPFPHSSLPYPGLPHQKRKEKPHHTEYSVLRTTPIHNPPIHPSESPQPHAHAPYTPYEYRAIQPGPWSPVHRPQPKPRAFSHIIILSLPSLKHLILSFPPHPLFPSHPPPNSRLCPRLGFRGPLPSGRPAQTRSLESSTMASKTSAASAEKWEDGTTDYAPARAKKYDIVKKPHISTQPITWGNWWQHVDWLNVFFILIVPAMGLIGSYWVPLQWKTAVFSVVYYFNTGLGITAGKISPSIPIDKARFLLSSPHSHEPTANISA